VCVLLGILKKWAISIMLCTTTVVHDYMTIHGECTNTIYLTIFLHDQLCYVTGYLKY